MNRSLVRAAACTLAAAASTALLLGITASSPVQAQITLSGFACSGTITWDGSTLTCSTGSTTTAPSGCSLAASPSSLPATGGSVTLTMTCTGSDPVASVQFSGGGLTGTTPCPTGSPCSTTTPIITTNTPFSATASDSSGHAGPTKSTTVTVATSGGGGGGGGTIDTSACTALGLNPKVATAAWTSNTNILTSNVGGFGQNDAVIVQFTTSSVTTSSAIGNLSAAEYAGPQAFRSWVLSDKPCDFTGGLNLYKLNSSGAQTQCKNADGSPQTTARTGSTSPATGFTVAMPGKVCNALLNAGQTYYWSLTNYAPPPGVAGSSPQCSSTTCNMLITLSKPSGT